MKKISILHVGYSDHYGGASIAMLRIHEALSKFTNVQSKIAVIHKVDQGNSDIVSLSDSIIEKIWCYLRVRVAYKLVQILQKTDNKSGRSINFFPSSVIKKLNNLNPDIIHFHWIGNETLKIEDIPKINTKIVWTFHDQWPYLGAEHTDINKSERFILGYRSLEKFIGIDFDRFTWERKLISFKQKKIHPVAVSKWIANEANSSLLWKDSQISVINNPIEIKCWEIRNKKKCRETFGIDNTDSIVLAFGAINCLNDKLKGYDLLFNAIRHLGSLNKKIVCLVFGNNFVRTEFFDDGNKIMFLGYVKTTDYLNEIYSAADVTVVPSYFESFGLTALESVLCGTPVACFNTSGLLDIVENEVNGYLADPYDFKSLSSAILQASQIKISDKYVQKFSEKFSYQKIGMLYYNLYKHVLDNQI